MQLVCDTWKCQCSLYNSDAINLCTIMKFVRYCIQRDNYNLGMYFGSLESNFLMPLLNFFQRQKIMVSVLSNCKYGIAWTILIGNFASVLEGVRRIHSFSSKCSTLFCLS